MATSQRKSHCGECKQKGHSARTCPTLGKGVKARPRPKQVEVKPVQGARQEITTDRIEAFNKATENLERLFDKKIITRKEFQEMQRKLNNSLEKGGEI